MEKKTIKVQIVEIFTAKAGRDWSRYFHGTIRRERDVKDNLVVYGKILVKNNIHNGHILAMANDQWELGKKLDDLTLMILDKGLHDNYNKFFIRYGFEYGLN
jgi:hypothetical protein